MTENEKALRWGLCALASGGCNDPQPALHLLLLSQTVLFLFLFLLLPPPPPPLFLSLASHSFLADLRSRLPKSPASSLPSSLSPPPPSSGRRRRPGWRGAAEEQLSSPVSDSSLFLEAARSWSSRGFSDAFLLARIRRGKMGDHFVLLVDHLLTESTLGAAVASRNKSPVGHAAAVSVQNSSRRPPPKMNAADGLNVPELVECRICQDDDLQSKMESPCSCRGSLKYAHRECVQRWCNEKGDTVCEICQQQFSPGFTAPQLFHRGGSPMNFRGNWEISRHDLRNPTLMTMMMNDRSLAGVASGDYADLNSRNLGYCRCVAVIFTVLLVLRHALPFLIAGEDGEHYSVADSTLLLLRVTGILLPIFVTARALAALHRRRRRLQEPPGLFVYSADEEDDVEEQPPPQWTGNEPEAAPA